MKFEEIEVGQTLGVTSTINGEKKVTGAKVKHLNKTYKEVLLSNVKTGNEFYVSVGNGDNATLALVEKAVKVESGTTTGSK